MENLDPGRMGMSHGRVHGRVGPDSCCPGHSHFLATDHLVEAAMSNEVVSTYRTRALLGLWKEGRISCSTYFSKGN